MMVMGLVMLGAIETNQAPLDVERHDADRRAHVRARGDRRAAPSPTSATCEDLVERMKADPSAVSFAGGSAGGTDQILLGLLAKAGGIDPSETKYIAYSGGGEANQAILSGSVRPASRARRSSRTRSRRGKMRVLAVSTAEPVDGRRRGGADDPRQPASTSSWRTGAASSRRRTSSPPSAPRWSPRCERLHDTPAWQEALERNGWTDFFKPGDEFTRFLDSENARVDRIIADLGLGG